ncbi:MAG: polysaccharide biosynthesis tyrosine autokinase, partial [Anaerolineaceae bacterium]
YMATVTLLVNQTPVAREGDISNILASERLALTYGQILAGRPVLEKVIAQLGLRESPNQLEQRITVEPIPDSQLLRLSVVSDDVEQVILLADAIAKIFVGQIQELQANPYNTRLDSLQRQMDTLSLLEEETLANIGSLIDEKVEAEIELTQKDGLLVEYRSDYRTLQQDLEQLRLTAADAAEAVLIAASAQVPSTPVQHVKLFTVIAAAVGFVMGTGLAFLLEYLDDKIRTPDNVNQMLDLGTLGSIGRLSKGDPELIAITQPRSPEAEEFRMLATNIRLSNQDKPLQTLVVTSPTSNEGKSILVTNLAVTMARSGQSVIVVDADLRLPRIHKLFELEQAAGLTDSLREGSINSNLQLTEIQDLRVLTSGKVPANPAKVINSPHLAELLGKLVQEADVVLIDSPPILPVADTKILAAKADGVLLVLRSGHTRSQAAQDAANVLRQVGAHLIGVVLNAVPRQRDSYYGYYGNGSEQANPRLQRWRQSLAVMAQSARQNIVHRTTGPDSEQIRVGNPDEIEISPQIERAMMLAGVDSFIDHETGLHNRDYFMLRLEQEISKVRSKNYMFALALVEINFSACSGIASSMYRIEVLRRFVSILGSRMREEDVMSRFDESKLALILMDYDEMLAKNLIEELIGNMVYQSPIGAFEDGYSGLQFSAGVVAFQSDSSMEEDALLGHAESALEIAHHTGSGKVILYAGKRAS